LRYLPALRAILILGSLRLTAADVFGRGDFVYEGFSRAEEPHFNSGYRPTLDSFLLIRCSQCFSNPVSLRDKEEYKSPGNEGSEKYHNSYDPDHGVSRRIRGVLARGPLTLQLNARNVEKVYMK